MKMIMKLFLVMLLILGLGATTLDVTAKTAPETITLKSRSNLYYLSEKNNKNYIGGYNMYRKELIDGTLAYCASGNDKDVPAGRTLVLKGVNNDMGFHYIIENGYPNKTFTGDEYQDYYITQAAIWRYFDEVYGSNNWGGVSFTDKSTGMKGYIYTLVQGAKLARNTTYEQPSISVSTDNNSMNLSVEGTYLVSNVINVTSKNIKGSYTVDLKNAPNGTILRNSKGVQKTEFEQDESFIVYVPVSSLTSQTGEISLTISAMGVSSKTYIYTPNSSTKQDIIPVTTYEEETGIVSDLITLNYKHVTTKVKISKQDIATKEELPGATLVIKDNAGNEVAKWVSTNEPHYIEGLAPGDYTLTEIIAPVGYLLTKETISFTVKDDGSVTSVVMYNQQDPKPTKVKISKQDITTKEELPGATLVIKDNVGNEVAKWVSTNEPYYIEELDPGDYTLTEIIAPSGYVLSKETIDFTVKDDGSITSVIMYNAKESKLTKVKISKQDITTKEELPGATLIVKDNIGNELAKWVSTNEPYYIEGLDPGDYTLTEIVAPSGYVLSEETVKFTVKDDGSTTSVVMYNTRYTEVPITNLDVSKTTMIFATILVIIGMGTVVYYVKYSK